MNLLQQVNDALSSWPQPRQLGNDIVVPTTVLYDGGGIVNVIVSGGIDTFQVHDDAGGLADFENCGGELRNPASMLRSHFRNAGIMVDRSGRISLPPVTQAGLSSAISVVANASRDASAFLLKRWHPVVRRKFKELVEEFVRHEFPQRWTREIAVVGRSNKVHRFDFGVELGGERRLLLDAVVPDATAINTAVVRHLDVREVHRTLMDQRILYDDRLPWKSSDLALLKIGAPPIAWQNAPTSLERLH